MEANSVNYNNINSMLQRWKAFGLVCAILICTIAYSQEIKCKKLNPCYTCEDKAYRAKGFIVAGCTIGLGAIGSVTVLPGWYCNTLVGATIYLNVHGVGLYLKRKIRD